MKRIITAVMVLLCVSLFFVSCNAGKNEKDYALVYASEVPDENNAGILKSEYSMTSDEIEQKLIKNCKIQAETKDYDAAVSAINAAITEADGYIESQNASGISYGSNGTRQISMTIRIPSATLDAFTNKMDGLLNVTSVYSSVENVTEAYYDAEAKLATLKSEHDSLLNMMESLNTAEDYAFWSELFNQVSALEQEIASLEATIRNYDKKVTYSTVSIDLYEVHELTVTKEPSFGERIDEAFKSSWAEFADGCRDFAVGFVEAFPSLLVFFVVTGSIFSAIFFPIMHSRRKRRKKENKNK